MRGASILADYRIEPMLAADWDQVREIYLQGIAGRNSTFETDTPSWDKWSLSHLKSPRLVARGDRNVLGWGALSPVSARKCYAGVAEASVYVSRASAQRC